jgi:predicted RNA-binding Zn-ribbon protein involved in translation (DUF1610 family)
MLECVRCGYEVGEIASERAGFICPECGTTDRPEETITRRDMFRAVVSMCWPVWVAAGVFAAGAYSLFSLHGVGEHTRAILIEVIFIVLVVSGGVALAGAIGIPFFVVTRLKRQRRWRSRRALVVVAVAAVCLNFAAVAGSVGMCLRSVWLVMSQA